MAAQQERHDFLHHPYRWPLAAGIVGRPHRVYHINGAKTPQAVRKEFAIRECSKRHVGLPTGWDWANVSVPDMDRAGRLWTVRSEYRHHYSNRAGDWWTGATLLCGYDDGGHFVHRCPQTLTTIQECLAWLTPAAVARAETAGRWVARQGDVWLVELSHRPDNLAALPWSHTWDAEHRTLVHRAHKPVEVPESVRAVRAYMPKAIGRGAGD